jgi:hypothetical protein
LSFCCFFSAKAWWLPSTSQAQDMFIKVWNTVEALQGMTGKVPKCQRQRGGRDSKAMYEAPTTSVLPGAWDMIRPDSSGFVFRVYVNMNYIKFGDICLGGLQQSLHWHIISHHLTSSHIGDSHWQLILFFIRSRPPCYV